jgi:effector-binding domain-containing protein
VHLACCCRQDAVTGSGGTSSAASGPKRSTYWQLTEWAAAEGRSLAVHMWESYLTDPRAEPDPATWQTMIAWPLA